MFQPRVVNNTDISFSDRNLFSELPLLQKGTKYNIDAKKKMWMQNLALDAEITITNPPMKERHTGK